MKWFKTLILFIIFLAAAIFINNIPAKCIHTFYDYKYQTSSGEGFTNLLNFQNPLIDNRSDHNLIYSVTKKSGIEIINNDDLTKFNHLLNLDKTKLNRVNRGLKDKNNFRLNMFLPGLSQIQKTVQSEFLLI
jgi:hypothetical protein